MKSERIGATVFSRRRFARILSGAILARSRGVALPVSAVPLEWSLARAPMLSLERHYRADAQVLVFGVPLLRRENVGGGSVEWREFDSTGKLRLIEFNGFSTPERAAGLNRLGFIREMSSTRADGTLESIYFGLMTASAEESAEEAQKALHSAAREQAYTAIDGHIGGGGTQTAVAHFLAPASLCGRDRAALMEDAHTALASVARQGTAQGAGAGSGSFLQTLAELLLQPGATEGGYSYSGRNYKLRITRTSDVKATAYFRDRNLIDPAREVLRVIGRLRRESGGKETEFRLWIPSGTARPLPLRIEYQAKSYLRLVFEAVAS